MLPEKLLAARRGRRAAIAVVATALVLGVVLLAWDWNWFKPLVERRVQVATSRHFAIDGDLHASLGRTTVVTAERLRLGNAAWSEHPQMAQLERLEVHIALRPLLRREIVLPYVAVQRPHVLLERNDQGEANWVFGPSDAEPSPPRIDRLRVSDGQVTLIEPSLQTNLQVQVRSGDPSAPGEPEPLLAAGHGTYRGEPFDLEAQADSPLELRNADRPYRVELSVVAGDTRARASGALVAPMQLTDFAVRFQLAGSDLAKLSRLTDLQLPSTPPYSLDGELSRRGSTWSYTGFQGRIGDSDIGGDVAVDLDGPRPMLRASLASRRIDLDDLAALIGAPPKTGPGHTASIEQRKQAEAQRQQRRVLPDAPVDLSKLRAMDAQVRLHADRVRSSWLPVEAITANLQLQAGRLRIDPLTLRAAGGKVAGALLLDASGNALQAELRLRANGVDVPKLIPAAQALRQSTGRLAGEMALTARGASVAQLVATAHGQVALAMGPGHLSNLILELVGLDVAEALRFLVRDKMVPLRCAWADLAVEQGVVHSRSFALDTTDTVLYVEGDVDLREEAIRLRLVPQPKDPSPLTLRTPLRLTGTFKKPAVRPEPGPLMARGAAAVALAMIAPPAALLAFIETGPGKDTDCGVRSAAPRVAGEAIRKPR